MPSLNSPNVPLKHNHSTSTVCLVTERLDFLAYKLIETAFHRLLNFHVLHFLVITANLLLHPLKSAALLHTLSPLFKAICPSTTAVSGCEASEKL